MRAVPSRDVREGAEVRRVGDTVAAFAPGGVLGTRGGVVWATELNHVEFLDPGAPDLRVRSR